MKPMSESLIDLAARVKELEEAEQFVGQRLRDPLSDGETRVLRYLPTNLTAAEIAGELYVSVHTVKTHIRHIYAKLGTHRRRKRSSGRARSASSRLRPYDDDHGWAGCCAGHVPDQRLAGAGAGSSTRRLIPAAA